MELVCLISGRSSHLFEVYKVYKVICVWIEGRNVGSYQPLCGIRSGFACYTISYNMLQLGAQPPKVQLPNGTTSLDPAN